ncbi:hypothetical protein ATI02_2899 [Pseudomonas baetica]|uniref:Uncharacterized protein n=1 Tax=Pseudomonas baetica TaxID=674054 RepID=A0ABX4PZR0_9PSED|nr:hypothetical protein [Pseudomonas baetica]PKA70021.1 hypothetical protein ATI02_2899 [Pseudomonas baetica]PTC21231.1 hypothetical protein C0J26_01115 [Pseudomonas baetica]
MSKIPTDAGNELTSQQGEIEVEAPLVLHPPNHHTTSDSIIFMGSRRRDWTVKMYAHETLDLIAEVPPGHDYKWMTDRMSFSVGEHAYFVVQTKGVETSARSPTYYFEIEAESSKQ